VKPGEHYDGVPRLVCLLERLEDLSADRFRGFRFVRRLVNCVTFG
jgi:hypothetical protein